VISLLWVRGRRDENIPLKRPIGISSNNCAREKKKIRRNR
jgi:hypothetical protein